MTRPKQNPSRPALPHSALNDQLRAAPDASHRTPEPRCFQPASRLSPRPAHLSPAWSELPSGPAPCPCSHCFLQYNPRQNRERVLPEPKPSASCHQTQNKGELPTSASKSARASRPPLRSGCHPSPCSRLGPSPGGFMLPPGDAAHPASGPLHGLLTHLARFSAVASSSERPSLTAHPE